MMKLTKYPNKGEKLKKIWPWLFLFLLLVFFCIWSKKDSIYLSSNNHSLATVSNVIKKNLYIDFNLTQEKDSYILSGKFTNVQQQINIRELLLGVGRKLIINHTIINQALKEESVIALIDKILPYFVRHYNNGKIIYHNQKLIILGIVNSSQTQVEMKKLLTNFNIISIDKSSIFMKSPIEYSIYKNNKTIHAEGIFNNTTQISHLKTYLPANTKNNFQIKKYRTDDNGSLQIVEKFLPLFLSKYTKGGIVYSKGKLTISGNVHSSKELKKIETLLAGATIPIINRTIIDPNILAIRKAEEKAIKLKIENLFKIENIEFDFDKSSLTSYGQNIIDKLVGILKQYPSVKVEILGYADSDGDTIYNQNLSKLRADKVKTELIAQHIKSDRLTAKGYGETRPLVPNTTLENKAKNRRVEINIQKGKQ